MATGDPATQFGFRFDDVSVRAAPPGRGADDGSGPLILDRVDLAIGRGLTVVAGPSGSGKSTLLRLCNRLEVPTSGRVLLDGCDLVELDPLALRRRAAMVFQAPVVFAGTVLDNLRVAQADVTAEGAVAALAGVGLDAAFVDRQADDLSGGEAQRVCLARALLTDPEVLLMDEATSALDIDTRLVIEQLARGLADGGLTVVWVTHDLEQAERIADRVVVVFDGRVVPDDLAAEALARRSFTALRAAASAEAARAIDAPAPDPEPDADPAADAR